MSCHLQNKAHIDTLVDTFFNGPSDTKDTIDVSFPTRDTLGKELAMENLRNYAWYHSYNAVAAAHPERDYSDEQNSIDAWAFVDVGNYSSCKRDISKEIGWRKNYEHTPRTRKLNTVEALAAIGQWQYSTGDRPGADKTETWALMEILQNSLISNLPGYTDFEEITEDNAPILNTATA